MVTKMEPPGSGFSPVKEMRQYRGRWTSLRDVEPVDLPALYRAEVGTFFRLRGRTPSPAEYSEVIWNGILSQAIVAASNGSPLGLVSAYNADLGNGYVFLMVLSLDDSPLVGARVMDGVSAYLDYLFDNFPLRKVYAETDSITLGKLGRRIHEIFVVEGVLREHVFRRGQYLDMIIMSLPCDRWREMSRAYRQGRDPLLRRDAGPPVGESAA